MSDNVYTTFSFHVYVHLSFIIHVYIISIINAPRTTSASVSRSRRHPVAAERLAGWQEDVGRVSAAVG